MTEALTPDIILQTPFELIHPSTHETPSVYEQRFTLENGGEVLSLVEVQFDSGYRVGHTLFDSTQTISQTELAGLIEAAMLFTMDLQSKDGASRPARYTPPPLLAAGVNAVLSLAMNEFGVKPDAQPLNVTNSETSVYVHGDIVTLTTARRALPSEGMLYPNLVTAMDTATIRNQTLAQILTRMDPQVALTGSTLQTAVNFIEFNNNKYQFEPPTSTLYQTSVIFY